MIWPTKKLGEVCEVVGGGTPSTGIKTYWDGDIVWVTPKDMGQLLSGEIGDTTKKITQQGVDNSSAKLLPAGSVILSSRAPIGYLAINTVPMATNQGCRSFVCGDQIFNKYLYYFLIKSRDYLQTLGSGSTFLEVPGSRLKEIEIPLPPIEEQRRIVKKLEKKFAKIDEAARLRAQSETATAALLPAALHEIFSQSESKGWNEKEFSEVVTVEAKKNAKKLPYVGMEDVESGTGKFLGSREVREVRSSTSYFSSEHVLYGKLRPYLNKFLLPDFEGHCSTEFLPLRPDTKFLTREWLVMWLRSNEIVARINATGAGARMPRANMKEVAKFKIPLPSLAEQKAIVKKLDALSEKVRALRELQSAQSADLKSLKQSILHEAFSGGVE